MLYSYTISENFLKELSTLDHISQHKICSFIRGNFIDKENLYLKIDRKILTKKYNGLDNSEINDLIQNLSNNVKDIFAKKVIPIDLALCGKSENFPVKIDCKLILNNRKTVKDEIKKRLRKSWPIGDNEKTVKKLESNLKRILNFNSIIVFNYRYLMQPFIERAENIGLSYKQKMQLNGYIFFLKLLIKLRNQNNSRIKFYTTISPRHDKKAKKSNFNIESELKKLSKLYLKKNDEIVVKKYDHNLWDLFHKRLLVTYLDEEQDFLEDDLNVFGHEGLDFLKDEKTINIGKELVRHDNDYAYELWNNRVKKVNEFKDLLKIVA